MFALVDCNNFYASCERVFQPQLATTPIVVLSNNDGCIIARSAEARQLGVEMGGAWFKVRHELERLGVKVFSSNYPLYGDLSRRVMSTLFNFTPQLEIYSIDEAFLELHSQRNDSLEQQGRRIQQTVKEWTGIPVSVGIGPSKTLAKIANRVAKKSARAAGVMNFDSLPDTALALSLVDIRDVWGIGRRLSRRLEEFGINNALDLRDMSDSLARREMGVTGLRTVWELRGISCLPLEEAPSPRRGVGSSRSFGRPVERFSDLREAVVDYVSRAALKLRREQLAAGMLTVYLSTGRHGKGPHYYDSRSQELPAATWSTPLLARLAGRLLQKIYRSGFRYRKVGVQLDDLVPQTQVDQNLFEVDDHDRTQRLMNSLDGLNDRHGQGTVRLLAAGVKQEWSMKRRFCSPRYTTSWDEIPRVSSAPV